MNTYRHITKLPLWAFIDCLVDGNLQSLTISGEPGEVELLEAWEDITRQYAEAMGNNEQTLYLSLYKQINTTAIAIDTVNECVRWMRNYYTKEFADKLNRTLHTSFQFDPTNPEAYDKLLNRCLTRTKEMQLHLQTKVAQFEAIAARQQKEGEKPTREYFQSVLITLSDHAKINLTDEMTVYQFIERIKRLNAFIERQKTKR